MRKVERANRMSNTNKSLLAEFPVSITLPVEWGQMDAFGHVNNTVYFRYFESARIAYFEKAGILAYMQEHGIGPILRDTQCRFRIPLAYPDTVDIGARVLGISGDRFEMGYRVVSHKATAVAADGSGTAVWLNYKNSAKTPVPPELTAEINRLEGKQV